MTDGLNYMPPGWTTKTLIKPQAPNSYYLNGFELPLVIRYRDDTEFYKSLYLERTRVSD